MPVTVRSFAKINLGLCIGVLRPDGFHELRTLYQTIALHDIIRVELTRGTGIEIRCEDPRVPKDETNTCHRTVERGMETLKTRGRVIVEIEKRLPVQGGLGGASGNAVAALLALERTVKRRLSGPERLRIAAEVGSDLPLFLIGGTVLGVGHGEDVYPLPDLPVIPCVIALPEIAVSTPKAFAEWDKKECGADAFLGEPVGRRSTRTAEDGRPYTNRQKLTHSSPSDRMLEFSRALAAWLSNQSQSGSGLSGVSAKGRAGPRPRFSTSSVPGSKTTSSRSSFLNIPSCARRNVCLAALVRFMRRYRVPAQLFMVYSGRSLQLKRPQQL